MFDLQREISLWRRAVGSREAIGTEDAQELEDHLRDEVENLQAKGLTTEEAFLIACKRLGEARALSGEFKKVGGLVWKTWSVDRREAAVAAGMAGLAGLLALLPTWFGWSLFESTDSRALSYLRWGGFFFIVPLTLFFFFQRRSSRATMATTIGGLAAGALVISLYPLESPYQTAVLSILHLPFLLWYAVLVAYQSDDRSAENRMNFVRITGEAVLFGVLILLGGLVLTALVLSAFSLIGVDALWFGRDVLGVAGLFATPVVAVFLADSKKGVVENLAPVLARLFSPLFLLALVVFLIVGFGQGKNPFGDRDSLAVVDGVLGLTLALVVYGLSARKTHPSATADAIQFGLVVVSLVIGVAALVAVAWRIGDAGVTPNKLALLGANGLLLANLGLLAYRYLAAFVKRGTLDDLVRVQTAFLPWFAGWAGVVALVFPLVFGFR